MADQEKEKSQELGLIDITEILSDYLRIFRRMWAWVLIFTILGAGLSYVRARLQYQPVYGIGNIYGKYTERTAGRCGYGFCVFL